LSVFINDCVSWFAEQLNSAAIVFEAVGFTMSPRSNIMFLVASEDMKFFFFSYWGILF
jgi:hypothetical protein